MARLKIQNPKSKIQNLDLLSILVDEEGKGAPGLCCGLCVIYLRLGKRNDESTLLIYVNSITGEGELQSTVMRITTSKNWITEFKDLISPLGLKVNYSNWRSATKEVLDTENGPKAILEYIAACPFGMVVVYGGQYSHALGVIVKGGNIYLLEPNKGFYLFKSPSAFATWVITYISKNPAIQTCMVFSIT